MDEMHNICIVLIQRPMFNFTPDVRFQYNATCQLHYRLLLDQKGVKYVKELNNSIVTNLSGFVTYFVKVVDAGT